MQNYPVFILTLLGGRVWWCLPQKRLFVGNSHTPHRTCRIAGHIECAHSRSLIVYSTLTVPVACSEYILSYVVCYVSILGNLIDPYVPNRYGICNMLKSKYDIKCVCSVLCIHIPSQDESKSTGHNSVCCICIPAPEDGRQ